MGIESLISQANISAPAFNFALMFKTLGLGLAWALAIWWLWPRIRYPIQIEYFELKGGNLRKPMKEFATEKYIDGIEKLYLFKHKKYIEPVPGTARFPMKGIPLLNPNKDKVFMIKDASGFFHHIDLKMDDKDSWFEPIEKDVLFFFQQERKRKFEKYMNLGWKQHLPMLVFGTTAVLSLVIVILTIKYAGNAVEQAIQVSSLVAEATNGLTEAIRSLGMAGAVTP